MKIYNCSSRFRNLSYRTGVLLLFCFVFCFHFKLNSDFWQLQTCLYFHCVWLMTSERYHLLKYSYQRKIFPRQLNGSYRQKNKASISKFTPRVETYDNRSTGSLLMGSLKQTRAMEYYNYCLPLGWRLMSPSSVFVICHHKVFAWCKDNHLNVDHKKYQESLCSDRVHVGHLV